ncbi:MAG TPA: hypothetical protein VF062_24790 [Candidatus Limnocylindrales bacterium]
MGETPPTGKGSTPQRGLISGYVWKLIRESVSLTQCQLAEWLSVDVATVQGWESGRRPLTALRAGDLARLRVRLIGRGAAPKLFTVLTDAIEADIIIDHALHFGTSTSDPRHHPLAVTVHRRDLTNLITWPFNRLLPTQLGDVILAQPKRRGPAAAGPTVSVSERRRFFDHLLAVAEMHQDPEYALLRRQAVYLLSFDSARGTRDWLEHQHVRAVRRVGQDYDLASWVAVRSSAVSLTRYGQRDPLAAFVRQGFADADRAAANLNYWAYWLGEVPEIYVDDGFMARNGAASWDGRRILRHLLARLEPGADQFDLDLCTVWQLVVARPRLLADRPDLRVRLSTKTSAALDHGDLDVHARRELSDIAYAIKLSHG